MSEQEEFEFRARAEAEAEQEAKQQAQPQATMTPGAGPVEPGMLSQAADFVTQKAIPTAFGVGQAVAGAAAAHPVLAGAGAAALFPKVAAKVPGVGSAIELGKGAIDAANAYSASRNVSALSQLEHQARQYLKMGQQVPQGLQNTIDSMRAKVAPPMPSAPAPAAAAQQPGIMQRGMDIATKMRQFAAQRVLPVAGVPGAVAAGGAAATGLAGGQMRAMTPEDRKKFYENEMLGAMSGDAGLAAAIMNRGQ